MDPDTQEELREAFQAGAKNKPTLGLNELAKALMWLGQNPTPQELSQMLAAAGGGMTFEAFCKVMSSSLAENKAEEVVEAFSVFDKDGRGFISASDLRHVLTGIGDRLDEDQVEEMLRASVGGGDGQLNYGVFVKTMMAAQQQGR